MKKILWFCLIVIACVVVIQMVERCSSKKQLVYHGMVPLPQSAGEIIEHSYYTLAYNEEAEQPYWVFYLLTPDRLKGSARRTDRFVPDPAVTTGSAVPQDYTRSGYDKGHLCPAADAKHSAESMRETFYMSNMSPQTPMFNRGVWRKLETWVRNCALTQDSLWVATGPIFKDCRGTIGKNRVTVPGYFYKILYSPQKGAMIAFVLANEKQQDDFSEFVVSVDSVESLTQIDFFPNLRQEDRMERQSDWRQWNN